MTDPFMDEQFDLLRTKVEAEIETPAVILVSSACARDGKSVTAYGLATSFSSSNYRTVLVDANHLAPTIADERAPVSLAQFAASGPRHFARPAGDGKLSAISFAKDMLRRGASRPTLSRAIDACREAYEIVIVDSGPLGDSNLAMMLANQANGIVLTVRQGRAITRADHELIKMLENLGLQTLGTVTVSPKTIGRFRSNVAKHGASVKTLLPVEAQARTRTAVG